MQLDIFETLYKPLPKVTHIKLGTFFSGIGSPEKALKRIGMDYELMFFSEIDKYAIQSYCQIHNEDISKNKGDITKIKGKDLPYADLWFGGFPCQDISLAGKRKGWEKDTRSSLGWEMIRLLDEVKEKPKYIIFENVANIMSEPMRPTLNLFKQDLEARGYTLWNEMLNAKDYGIPQNRERYFLIAILGEYYYNFPPKQELKLRLKDMLEDEVDEKYYLKDYQIKHLQTTNFCSQKIENAVKDPNTQILGTILTMRGGNREPMVYVDEATTKGYTEAIEGDSINLERPNSQTRRGRVGKQVAQTLTTSCNQGVVENKTICLNSKGGRNGIEGLQPSLKDRIYDSNGIATCVTTSDFYMPNYTENVRIRKLTPKGYAEVVEVNPLKNSKGKTHQQELVQHQNGLCRTIPAGTHASTPHLLKTMVNGLRIRKLTPKECYRLMGFDDEDYEKASKVCSNSQLYKQAGNSIVVNVLEAIFKELFKVGD